MKLNPLSRARKLACIFFLAKRNQTWREKVRQNGKLGIVLVRQGERKLEEVETALGSRRRGRNSVKKSEERRRQREKVEGKAETA